jgi:hypothetical protein
MISTHKLFIHTVCEHVLSGEEAIFSLLQGVRCLCYVTVCLASLGGMGKGREVDEKGEGRNGRSVSSSTSCLFLLDPISR